MIRKTRETFCTAIGPTLLIGLVSLLPLFQAEAKPFRWSAESQTAAIEAATSTAEAATGRFAQANMLLELAQVLKEVGRADRVPGVLEKVRPLLTRVEFGEPYAVYGRGLVRQLVEAGEDEAAEHFVLQQDDKYQHDFRHDLGMARVDHDDLAGAERAASHVSKENQKATIWAAIAQKLCAADQQDKRRMGQSLARRLEGVSKAFTAERGKQYFGPALPSVKAIARCSGPAAAIAFANDNLPDVEIRHTLDGLASYFARSGQMELARELDPPLQPDNFDDLLREASRLIERRELAAARDLTLRAANMIDKSVSEDSSRSWEKERRRQALFSFLVKQHSYQDALALLPSPPHGGQRQYYIELIREASAQGLIREVPPQKDEATIAKVLPAAMACVEKGKEGDAQYLDYLASITMFLLEAEMLDLARIPYDVLKATMPDRRFASNGSVARAKVMMGDGVETCREYDEAGALTVDQPAWSALTLAIMMGDGDKTAPTHEELMSRLAVARKALPALAPGPRAIFLRCSIDALAQSGQTEAALMLLKELEVEPRDVLRSPRNIALQAIADAYHKSGDADAELAIAVKIDEPRSRWLILLRLLRLPVSQ
ncbi:hypothetical protein GIW81_18670 [Hyphomicrobium sp. xq]|uniref:Tetratricopeptide repeat-containing protein n=1 Tax=Hyphomicrobium album TaxID=2665159 RepID=A0A6I3KSN0_9HYPH|nr:hypothetical protein [Hyphomicrobium album]MTD96366.1 hypothetical protein [Hyphomicrobium album]